MKNTAVTDLRNLNGAARDWLRTLFGREIAEDERIIVSLSPKCTEPTAEDKATAKAGLEGLFAQIDPHLRTVSDAEFEEALDEACEAVRRTKK